MDEKSLADKRARRRRWEEDEAHSAHIGSKGAMGDINVTPFIDVLLVLLIIFMVVTPLAQKGLDISLPQPPPPNQPKDTSPRNQVVLSLEENAILINKNPVGLPELGSRLRDIFQARSDKTMFVKASGEVPYGDVVQAMDIARGSGVERIGIISEQMIEQAGGVVEEGGAAGAQP